MVLLHFFPALLHIGVMGACHGCEHVPLKTAADLVWVFWQSLQAAVLPHLKTRPFQTARDILSLLVVLHKVFCGYRIGLAHPYANWRQQMSLMGRVAHHTRMRSGGGDVWRQASISAAWH